MRLSDQLPSGRLREASEALDRGETAAADALFASVRAERSGPRAANAAMERAKLAEIDIRWDDAARHYAKASSADGLDRYEHLVS